MSSGELFVVLIRVMGLYVLSGNALHHWATVLASVLVDSSQLTDDTFKYYVVNALTFTVVGLYLLIFAEQVARFADVAPRSSKADESDRTMQACDETAT